MDNILKNRKKSFLLFGAIFIVWLLAVITLKPFADDWEYCTAPNTSFTVSQLFQAGAFWRPIDVLVGALLGVFPFLFPFLNHFLIVLCHIVSAYYTCRILREFYKFSAFSVIISTVFFLFASGNFTAVASIDSLNQVCSQMFGILAFWNFIRGKEQGKKIYFIGYFLLCTLATLAKESGIMFGFVIPLLYYLNSFSKFSFEDIKNVFKKVITDEAIYFGIVVLYFVARTALGGEVSASDGRYTMHFSLLFIVKNIGVIVVGAFTSVDSIAILASPRNIPLAVITLVLNIGFIIALAISFVTKLIRKETSFRTLILLMLAIVMVLPNLITTVGEMHAYALAFFVALITAYSFDKYKSAEKAKRTVIILFALFMVSSVLSSGHKWIGMKTQGENSQIVTNQIQAAYEGELPPKNVLVLCVEDEEPGYSLFVQPVGKASAYGVAAKSLWQWKYPQKTERIFFETMGDAEQFMLSNSIDAYSKYDAVWLVRANGTFKRMK